MLITGDSMTLLSTNQTYSTINPFTDLTPNISRNSSCTYVGSEAVIVYRFIIHGLLLNFIGVLGVLGNIISMIILSRPQMRSSINYILIVLARIDTSLIITSMLLFGLRGIYPHSGLLFHYYYVVYPHIIPFIFPLTMISHTASCYLTLTVSLERFVAVCHPLRARSLCTYGRARMYVICILIFSVIYNIPRFFESTIISEESEVYNMTIYCPQQSTFRSNPLYVDIYINWMYFICMYLLPFGCLAVLNACIYRQVLKANKERQRLSRLQKREIGLATMLLGVVAIFFLCNLLPMVINIIETFNIRMEDDTFDYLVDTNNLLVTINSSVNFLIYVIFGEKFKRLFLILFCNNSIFGSGRESPDGATYEDSFMSNGDRQSLRLHRQNTTISRNGASGNRMNGSGREPRSTRCRASSPGPCVYYPANRASMEISTYTTQTSITGE